MIHYSFNRTGTTVTAIFSGNIGLNNIKHFYTELARFYGDLQVINMLQDERNANFTETDQIIRNGKELLEILTAKFKKVRIGILQTRPIETAYSTLFIDQVNDQRVELRIFYSEENVNNWLAR